jgi:hypothetical protein
VNLFVVSILCVVVIVYSEVHVYCMIVASPRTSCACVCLLFCCESAVVDEL